MKALVRTMSQDADVAAMSLEDLLKLEVEGAFVSNLTLTSPARQRVDFSISINNAFNTSYADPAAEEHWQQSIPQDGRALLARVRVKF